jgi:hypothetical protein
MACKCYIFTMVWFWNKAHIEVKNMFYTCATTFCLHRKAQIHTCQRQQSLRKHFSLHCKIQTRSRETIQQLSISQKLSH